MCYWKSREVALRPHRWVLVVGLIATALAVLASAVPFVKIAHENLSAHAAIETGTALVAWVASYLIFLRYRRSGLLSDLLLASALALLAATNLLFLVTPAALTVGSAEKAAMWATVYVCLGVGAVREVSAYYRGLAKVAVLEERRRLARDFHDGLAQELAYVVAYGRALARTTPDPAAGRLVTAAERALHEARHAIGALTGQADEPLDAALADTASEIAQREGAKVKLDLAPGVLVSAAAQEALVRVVREAVTNAIRHGHASTVKVHLDDGAGIHLRIEDDGQGFDVSDSPASGRFGLMSMEERTRALGGELRIVSDVGGGTAVEVTLP